MQQIKTPGGETLVILPLEDYEKLLDAVDIVAAGAVQARIETGEEELIPAEYVNRILGGESPVRIWREFRGLKAADLASKAGVSQAYLSEIETGKKDGSVAALKRIAAALNVDLGDIV